MTPTEEVAALKAENETLRSAMREALTYQYGGVILSDGSAALQDALDGKFDMNFPRKLHQTLCEIFDITRGVQAERNRGELLDALDAAIVRIEAIYPGPFLDSRCRRKEEKSDTSN